MLSRSEPVVDSALQVLHPQAIRDRQRIRDVLADAQRRGAIFHRGLNSAADLELGRLAKVRDDMLVLDTQGFDRPTNGQIFLNFEFDGRPCLFVTRRCGPPIDGQLHVRVPEAIFFSERRDRLRHKPKLNQGEPRQLEMRTPSGRWQQGVVTDIGPDGFGVEIQGDVAQRLREQVTIRFRDGREADLESRAQIRSRIPVAERAGWTRVGLMRSDFISADPIPVIRGVAAQLRPARSARKDPARGRGLLRIPNAKQEEIVALMDSFGDICGAPAVVVLNGWGQTKEALLPLARTLLATFAEYGQPIQVVRFDGIRKRGESYNDPECRIPGRENHNYVFSQGVDDILSVSRFLRNSPDHKATSIVVVSFSAAALEVRKAIATDAARTIDGWVSVVGSPDLQSMTRAISGGVDFVGGYERGLRFGRQELLGVTVDIDKIAVDAVDHSLSFLQDSRSDMAAISIPITWFHGAFDAWVELDRVRDILSCGNVANRKLVEIAIGHQLKNSRQASEAFGAIAGEVSRMAIGRQLIPVAANSSEVRKLRLEEQRRLPRVELHLKEFWRDYLVGRDRSLGIELLTSGSAYRDLMALQIDLLELESNDTVVDLGSGTGAFARQLFESDGGPSGVHVLCMEYVREALDRARARQSADASSRRELTVSYVESDLDLVNASQRIPLADESVQAIIASLFLSYVEAPHRVLADTFRILRPGGRMVISSLRSDADISRLYAESFAELQIGTAGRALPEFSHERLGHIARNFLNDAARILEFEDSGAFHFWDATELAEMLQDVGFSVVHSELALGAPPQAVVLEVRKS